MADLQVSILSPAKTVAKVTATSVEVPGSLGYLGILPGHTRFVSELGIGQLTVSGAEAGRQVFFIAGGYVDVANDHVTVLADVVEKPADINVKAAEDEKRRAEEALSGKAAVDFQEEQAALARAEARLAVVQRGKS